MNKNVQRIAITIFAAVIMVFLFLAFIMPHESMTFNSEKCTPYNENWQYADESGDMLTVTLPCKLDVPFGESYTIRHVLGDDLPYPAVVALRTSHQKLIVRIDGEEIYRYGHDDSKNRVFSSACSAWNLIRLPADSEGAEIEIEFYADVKLYNGVVNDLQIGSKASILFHILSHGIIQAAVSVLSILIGIVLITLHFVFVRKYDMRKNALSLALFTINIGMWLFGESKLYQFISGNMVGGAAITAVVFLLIPFFSVKYCRSIKEFKSDRVLFFLEIIYMVYAVVILILSLLKITDFWSIVFVVHACIGIAGAAILYSLIYDLIKTRDKTVAVSLISIIVLLGFGMLEIIWYYYDGTRRTGSFVAIGLLLFILGQGISVVKGIVDIYKTSRLVNFYSWLSHKDDQTRFFNRRAYDERMNSIINPQNTTIVMTDINNLKEINDNFGHAKGDKAIAACAEAINRVLGSHGQCYRIGGDEFVFIGTGLTEKRIEEMLADVQSVISDYKDDFILSAACGYAIFDSATDKTIKDTAQRADFNMYQKKAEMKQEAQNQMFN